MIKLLIEKSVKIIFSRLKFLIQLKNKQRFNTTFQCFYAKNHNAFKEKLVL